MNIVMPYLTIANGLILHNVMSVLYGGRRNERLCIQNVLSKRGVSRNAHVSVWSSLWCDFENRFRINSVVLDFNDKKKKKTITTN